MEHIPVLKVDEFLLTTIFDDASDRLIEDLQRQIVQALGDTGARGVLIDVSALPVIDLFLASKLDTTGHMARIMDADTIVVGVRPAVAMTLVELGLSFSHVRTALTVEHETFV